MGIDFSKQSETTISINRMQDLLQKIDDDVKTLRREVTKALKSNPKYQLLDVEESLDIERNTEESLDIERNTEESLDIERNTKEPLDIVKELKELVNDKPIEIKQVDCLNSVFTVVYNTKIEKSAVDHTNEIITIGKLDCQILDNIYFEITLLSALNIFEETTSSTIVGLDCDITVADNLNMTIEINTIFYINEKTNNPFYRLSYPENNTIIDLTMKDLNISHNYLKLYRM
jgi:hypothetical protein